MLNKTHMETTITTTENPRRRAAVGALAIVGFIALILIGIGLAIYTARYLPQLSSRLGSAVSLSSIFHRNDENASLQVVTATSTLPFADTATTSTSTLPVETPTATNSGSKGTKTSGTGSVTKYTTVTTTTTVAPYGDPDLAVHITQVGYLRTKGDTDTFVASSYVPSGKDGAVKFTVTNAGTNVTGEWKFSAQLPTSSSHTSFTSPYQDSLNPGDSADFVLGFTHSGAHNDRDIIVTLDPSNKIHESNGSNNEDTATIDLR